LLLRRRFVRLVGRFAVPVALGYATHDRALGGGIADVIAADRAYSRACRGPSGAAAAAGDRRSLRRGWRWSSGVVAALLDRLVVAIRFVLLLRG
jgi:hypothetical protein